MRYLFLLFLLSYFMRGEAHTTPVEFVVLIPSYNNEKWCEKNLTSVFKQTYPYWSMVYVNDNSKDATGAIVEQCIDTYGMRDRCTVVHNEVRVGAMENIYTAIHNIEPHKVVVCLDGDDWLFDETTLSILASTYANPNVWITYGSCIQTPAIPGAQYQFHEYPEEICRTLRFRSYAWQGCQLRTFYAKLFQNIKTQDLKWRGTFYPMSYDVAIMFPMLEMASQGHIRYIPNTLYVVNTTNPISDSVRNPKLQAHLDWLIRSKRPYLPINQLFSDSTPHVVMKDLLPQDGDETQKELYEEYNPSIICPDN